MKDTTKGSIGAAIVLIIGIVIGLLLFGCTSKYSQIVDQQIVLEQTVSDYVLIYEANHYMYADTLYDVIKASAIPGDYKTVITFEFIDKSSMVYSFPRLDIYILKQLSHVEN